MKKDIHPDNVVFNQNTKKYDASLKPYATSLGAPAISVTDTSAWKNRGILKVNKKIQSKYLELKASYDKMMTEYEYNNLIYNAEFAFEPVIGETYHLYKRDNGTSFLSLLSPNQCNFNSIGSFYLNSDQVWEKV